MAPQPLPTNAQRNRGLGSGSTAGILAAIPQSTIARSHDSAGLRSRAAVCPGSLFGWPRGRSGRSAAAWSSHAEGTGWRNSLGERARGRPCPRAGGARVRRPLLCVRGACVLRDAALPGAGRKLPPFKRACVLLSKASVPGSSSLPCSPPGRADLIIRAARGLPFRCWPEMDRLSLLS